MLTEECRRHSRYGRANLVAPRACAGEADPLFCVDTGPLDAALALRDDGFAGRVCVVMDVPGTARSYWNSIRAYCVGSSKA